MKNLINNVTVNDRRTNEEQIFFDISINNKKSNILIHINLSDECKNGHADFSVTASVWEVGKNRSDRNMICAGCCHDEILKAVPELKPLIDLHLADINGIPFGAGGNGRYFLQKNEIDKAKSSLRVYDDNIIEELNKYTQDNIIFTLKLQELGILDQWKKQADQGIEMIEKLTGRKISIDRTKSRSISVTPEQIEEAKEKVKNGYYSIEQMKQRDLQAIQDYNEKEINTILKKIESQEIKNKTYRDVLLFIQKNNIPLKNAIFYTHYELLRVSFNWKDYETTKATDDQIKAVKEAFKDVLQVYNNKEEVK